MKSISKIVADGKFRFRWSSEYWRQAREIKKEVKEMYAPFLAASPNFIRKIPILIRRQWEIRKRLAKLNSNRNLHIRPSWTGY